MASNMVLLNHDHIPSHGPVTIPPKRQMNVGYLIFLTIGLGGLQGIFSVQFSNGSPYLMSLGFTKSQVALILVAGPLAGVIGQPYFGICSDQCRSPYGKRRPFIVIGTVFTIIAMLGLAWVKEIVQSVLEIFTPNGGPDTIRSTVMTLSVGFVFLLNFAIQPIQSGLRSLIVDSCPPNQLNDANAWASRMIGMSNVACYGIGFFDLPKRWSIFIETQFKALCLLASLGLAVSIAINCWMIKERNSSLDPRLNVEVHTLLGKMRHFCSGFRRVSPQIMRVCHIQCFAWIGWFLFYCYITIYIGKIYLSEALLLNPSMTDVQQQATLEAGTRRGSLALFTFASMSLVTGSVVPLLVPSLLPSIGFEKQQSNIVARVIRKLKLPFLSLRGLWIFSHLLFASCMFSTLFISTTRGTTALIAVVGVSWAFTSWIPHAMIMTELSRLNMNKWEGDSPPRYETQPGMILSLHNIAIAGPQLIASLGSSLLFWLLERNNTKIRRDEDIFGLVLRLGGFAALISMYLSTKLSEQSPIFGNAEHSDIEAEHICQI